MIIRLKTMTISVVLKLCACFIRNSEDIVCFGSWVGNCYNDNPKYLFEYMSNLDTGYKMFWIGNKCIEKEIPDRYKYLFLKRDSLKAIYTLMRSKYCVCCQGEIDLTSFNFLKHKQIIYTDHGITIKKFGNDTVTELKKKKNIKYYFVKAYNIVFPRIKYSYITVSNDDAEPIYRSAIKENIDVNTKFIKTGTPRNDFLINASEYDKDKIKKKIAKKLGFDNTSKVILYAPTYRFTNSDIFSFSNSTIELNDELRNFLIENNVIIIEKNHYVTYKNNKKSTFRVDNKIFLGDDLFIDFQELLLISDVLICDYSGAILDYLCLNRPLILFCYDYEYYCNQDSGLYYSLEDFECGKICSNVNELLESVVDVFKHPSDYIKNRNVMKERFIKYEEGKASENIIKIIKRDNI